MEFTKMEGCGNDYVYINGFTNQIKNPNKLSEIVSNRNFGIGSDGLIVINPSDKADFRMNMYNADGSEGKMCGNGIRCVAKYVYDNKMTDKTTITVETLSGIKTLVLNVEDDKVKTVRVNRKLFKLGTDMLNIQTVRIINKCYGMGVSHGNTGNLILFTIDSDRFINDFFFIPQYRDIFCLKNWTSHIDPDSFYFIILYI